MTIIVVLCKLLIFLLLVAGMFFLVKAFQEYEILQKVRDSLDELDRQKLLEYRKKNVMQKMLDRLDEKLLQAGVKKYFPKAGVEIEKAGVVRSLVGEAALMTGVAAYGISTMLREFAGDVGFGNSMVDFFLHNAVGQICMILYLGLFFAMIQIILKFAKR